MTNLSPEVQKKIDEAVATEVSYFVSFFMQQISFVIAETVQATLAAQKQVLAMSSTAASLAQDNAAYAQATLKKQMDEAMVSSVTPLASGEF